jgi:predicted Na+-dependent transporter
MLTLITCIVLFLVGRGTEQLKWTHFAVIVGIATALTAASIALREMERSNQGREPSGLLSIEGVGANAAATSAIYIAVYLLGYWIGKRRRAREQFDEEGTD